MVASNVAFFCSSFVVFRGFSRHRVRYTARRCSLLVWQSCAILSGVSITSFRSFSLFILSSRTFRVGIPSREVDTIISHRLFYLVRLLFIISFFFVILSLRFFGRYRCFTILFIFLLSPRDSLSLILVFILFRGVSSEILLLYFNFKYKRHKYIYMLDFNAFESFSLIPTLWSF